MKNSKRLAVKILKTGLAGSLLAFYWYWINQKLIADTGQVFGLTGFFLLMSTATAYFPLPANILVLGAVKGNTALLVSFIAALSTVVAYLSEYLVFTILFRMKKIASFKGTWIYKKMTPLFDKHRFFILSFASFLPIPSEPLRIYAITQKYNKVSYISAGFVGRMPRYFLLGYFGKAYVDSIWFLLGVIVFPAVFLLFIRGAASVLKLLKVRFYAEPVETTPAPMALASLGTPTENSSETDMERPQ